MQLNDKRRNKVKGKQKKDANTQKKTEKMEKNIVVGEKNMQNNKPSKNISQWVKCATCTFAYQCNKKFCFKVIF